jgi:hypothetical protein
MRKNERMPSYTEALKTIKRSIHARGGIAQEDREFKRRLLVEEGLSGLVKQAKDHLWYAVSFGFGMERFTLIGLRRMVNLQKLLMVHLDLSRSTFER